jgi:hypothetical protein
MKFSMATVFSVTFSHALLLLLLGGSESGILPVTGSPLPRVVEPNDRLLDGADESINGGAGGDIIFASKEVWNLSCLSFRFCDSFSSLNLCAHPSS